MDYQKTRQLLILHEGLRLQAHQCPTGKTFIGVGRNLEDKGITHHEALYLLRNDIAECEADLVVTFPGWHDLSPVRKAVFTDMRFNLGHGGLREFRDMMDAARKRDWTLVAQEMLKSRWATQVGDRAIRLADALITDEWPHEMKEVADYA